MSPLDTIRDRLIRADELLATMESMGAKVSRTALYASIARGNVPGVVRLSAHRFLINGSVAAEWLGGTRPPGTAVVPEPGIGPGSGGGERDAAPDASTGGSR